MPRLVESRENTRRKFNKKVASNESSVGTATAPGGGSGGVLGLETCLEFRREEPSHEPERGREPQSASEIRNSARAAESRTVTRRCGQWKMAASVELGCGFEWVHVSFFFSSDAYDSVPFLARGPCVERVVHGV